MTFLKQSFTYGAITKNKIFNYKIQNYNPIKNIHLCFLEMGLPYHSDTEHGIIWFNAWFSYLHWTTLMSTSVESFSISVNTKKIFIVQLRHFNLIINQHSTFHKSNFHSTYLVEKVCINFSISIFFWIINSTDFHPDDLSKNQLFNV